MTALGAGRWALGAVGCALLLAAMVPAPVVVAQETAPPPVGEDPAFDARARATAAQLRCPVCLGNSIQDSPSELAQDMRQLVREQLAAGKSEAEIKEYFVARYGEWVLLNPTAEGFNLVVWLLPGVLLVGGAVVVWAAVRKWTTGERERGRAGEGALPPSGSPALPSADDEYVRRVREEVGRGEP
jgi:cytochrome c-type biogenesis protein CcmH